VLHNLRFGLPCVLLSGLKLTCAVAESMPSACVHLSARLHAALILEGLHCLLGLAPEDAVYRHVFSMVVEGLLENGDIVAGVASLEVCQVWLGCRIDGRIAARNANNVLGLARRCQDQCQSERR